MDCAQRDKETKRQRDKERVLLIQTLIEEAIEETRERRAYSKRERLAYSKRPPTDVPNPPKSDD